MSYSLCLFTATWLTGQTPAPLSPTITAPSATTTIRVVSPDTSGPMSGTIQVITTDPPPAPPPPAPGLLGRIRNLFSGHRDNVVTPAGYQVSGPGQPATVLAQPQGLELVGKELEKVGHEKDHSWITGKLFRVNGNRWILRYGVPYEVDPYQGSVQLAPHADLVKFQPGDLVCVHGGRVVSGRAALVYEVREINLVERAKR